MIWKKESDSKLVVCYNDTDALDEEIPRDPHIVAASARTFWEYKRLPEVEGVPQTIKGTPGIVDIQPASLSRKIQEKFFLVMAVC